MFAGIGLGFEKDEEGNIVFNEDKALAGMIGVAGLTRSQAIKKLSSKMDDKIAERLSRFSDVVNYKGVVSTKDGLKFKAVAGMTEDEAETAFMDGLSTAANNKDLADFASKKPQKIADLYADIVNAYRNK